MIISKNATIEFRREKKETIVLVYKFWGEIEHLKIYVNILL